MKEKSVGSQRLALLVLALTAALAVAAFAAAIVLAESSSAPATNLAPIRDSLSANPELNLLQRFVVEPSGGSQNPPSCAAQGGVCFPILNAESSVAA